MRKRILVVLLGIILVITTVVGFLPACSGGTTGPQPTGTTGGVAPTAQGTQWRWRYQSNANAGTATYWYTEELAALIEKSTGGRMVWELAPQGAIVGTMEIFDAVATKAIEVGTGCD